MGHSLALGSKSPASLELKAAGRRAEVAQVGSRNAGDLVLFIKLFFHFPMEGLYRTEHQRFVFMMQKDQRNPMVESWDLEKGLKP